MADLERRLPRWAFLMIYGVYASFKCTYILLYRYGWMKSAFTWKAIDRSGSPVPWITYPAIEYLEGLDLSSYDVLEVGSGNSTLYWSQHAKSVMTIENDEEWAKKLTPKLGNNAQIQFTPSEEGYIQAISELDSIFDIILIDGLHRSACAQHALSKLREGGLLILDDADRYPDLTRLLREHSLLQVDFAGFNPINSYTKTTTFFFHRRFVPKPRKSELPRPSWG